MIIDRACTTKVAIFEQFYVAFKILRLNTDLGQIRLDFKTSTVYPE